VTNPFIEKFENFPIATFALQMDLNAFINILGCTLDPNNEVRAAAEQQIKKVSDRISF
jgi:hypothetical protein